MPKYQNPEQWDSPTLTPEHLRELGASGIDEAIARHNFQSLSGQSAVGAVAGFKLDKVSGHGKQYATKGVSKTLERYQHCESGGWWCSGLDPLNKWLPMEWGCFKPDDPRTDTEGKVIKYEHPPSESTRAFFLRTEDANYWGNVEGDRSIPLILTEGAKKAACGLSHGLATVAVSGIWQVTKPKANELKDELKGIVKDRLVYVAFDEDTKAKTRKAVASATKKAAIALMGAGAKDVKVVRWRDSKGKGMDDFIVNNGIEAFEGAIAKAESVDLGTYRPHFVSSLDKGLQWVTFEHAEDCPPKPKREMIGNHLELIGVVDSSSKNDAGLYLQFKTFRGTIKRATISRRDIVDPTETLKQLNALGYQFKPSKKAKIRDYLNQLGVDCGKEFVVTPKTGWTDGSFVTVDKTYGNPDLRFGQVEPPTEPRFEQSGTLEEWKTNVAAMAIGNSRLTLGIGCSLAAPFLDLLGLESGGIHLAGETSKGKTTVATVAGSVYGHCKKTVTQWRATANGLEAIALEHNDLCLILDEIGQALPIDVAKAAYMLANGQAKIRMQKNRKVDPAKTWRLLFLSTGEIPLVDFLSSAGLPVKGGQEIRMPSIPAVPVNGHGVFETLHGFRTGADFVRALESAIAKYHGTAFDSFMGALIPNLSDEQFTNELIGRHAEITNALAQFGEGDEIIGRVAKRFAAIQIALEVARYLGIIPHSPEDIGRAIDQCFTDWVGSRGGVGSIEVKTACERIRHLLVTNQMSDRIHIVGDSSSVVRNLLAHRSGDEFWVPTSVFNAEFVGDCEKKSLIRELQARGWLKMPTQSDRHTIKVKITGVKTINAYVFDFQNMDLDTGTTGTTGTNPLGKGFSGSRFFGATGTNGNQGAESDIGQGIQPKSKNGNQNPKKQGDRQDCDDFMTSVPVVPVSVFATGTNEPQSQQGGSRGSRGSRSQMQDSEKNSDSDDQTELIPIDPSEIDLTHLDGGHGDDN